MEIPVLEDPQEGRTKKNAIVFLISFIIYAQNLVLVNLILVNFFGFSMITGPRSSSIHEPGVGTGTTGSGAAEFTIR